MAAAKKTQKQLDSLIKAADLKIEKYKGYIAKLNEEKKSLNAQKRALVREAEKKATAVKKTVSKTAGTAKKTVTKAAGTAKKTAAKATATAKKTVAKKSAAKKTPAKKTAAKPNESSLLEGIADELKKGGLDVSDILGSLLGGK